MSANEKKVQIADTTLRDAHQSLLATRLTTPDMEIIAPLLDNVGFHSVEMWGGATFDSMHRFLDEDPWERPRILKKLMPKTPFSMLLRGQNLVGYRQYPDDVAEAFIEESAEAGIDIFRVFDALNDERNFETSYRVIKRTGRHIQGTISYTLTEQRLGGPVFNLDYYLGKARIIEDMGADSLCIKDMAGLMAPDDAALLIKALKETVKIPLHLHGHCTSGMAMMTYMKAIEAGVDVVDCVCAPVSMRNSLPAVEPLIVALKGAPRDCGLDLEIVLEIDRKLAKILEGYRQFLKITPKGTIDPEVLHHQIPGGMTSNLLNQLKEADALDRLPEVQDEVPRVRKELGYPPLVTPTSQIVGVQSVLNVLAGRYAMVSGEVKDYLYGLYGRPPAPIDRELQEKILADYPRGRTPITCRPADLLEPEMDRAYEEVAGILGRNPTRGEALIYAIYPVTGRKYLAANLGGGADGKEEKKEDEGVEMIPLFILDHGIEERAAAVAGPGAPGPAVSTPKTDDKPLPADGKSIKALMPGTIIRFEVAEGDSVKRGQALLVLESMKMENHIPAPRDGVIKEIRKKEGDHAGTGEVLIVME
ncbi:MAG: pyruvate carboxylase subunit B [Pseudomonadota bacterium]